MYDDGTGDIGSYVSSLTQDQYDAQREAAIQRNLWMLMSSGGMGTDWDSQFVQDWFKDIYGFDLENPLEGEWKTDFETNPLQYITGTEGDYSLTNLPDYLKNGYKYAYYDAPWTNPGSYADTLPYALLMDVLESTGMYGIPTEE